MSRTKQENKDKANDRTVKDKKTSYRLAASKVISCGVLMRKYRGYGRLVVYLGDNVIRLKLPLRKDVMRMNDM